MTSTRQLIERLEEELAASGRFCSESRSLSGTIRFQRLLTEVIAALRASEGER